MLVETKAKVGVFAIALGAYLPQFPTLVPEFEAQYDAFKKTIPDTVEMIDGGIVTTKELSMEAGDKFRAADVDLVILQLLTYATSYNMLPAVRDLNVPVVLVNVQKRKAPDYANTDTPKWLGELYACGAVGEMVADLERAGKRHAVITGVVEGGDAYVAKEIDEWCRAAQVRRRFRYTNIAQIGRPYPGMMDLYIDETNLYNRMGLYTKQFDWEKIWAIADPVTDEAAIRAKAEEILDTFDIEGGTLVCVAGRNAAGKTTLLKAVAGMTPHTGAVTLTDGSETFSSRAVAYLPQLTQVTSRLTVFEIVMLGLGRSLSWRVTPDVFEKVDQTLGFAQIRLLSRAGKSSSSLWRRLLSPDPRCFFWTSPRAPLICAISSLSCRLQWIT